VRHGRGARTGEHREYANQSELPFASSFIIELLHHPAQSPFSLRALPSMSLITIRCVREEEGPFRRVRLKAWLGYSRFELECDSIANSISATILRRSLEPLD